MTTDSDNSANWSVYMVRCNDGSLYTGIARDVARRLAEHQAQGSLTAKYLRGRAPLVLVYARQCGSRAEASREEHRIKKLQKDKKEDLVQGRQ